MTEDVQDPRLETRKRAIVCSAHKLFIERGFERTTLQEIVERSGGSLATIYKLFGNKDGLLEAVTRQQASSGETIIREAFALKETPANILHRLARDLRAHFLNPETVALVRIVIARSIEDTDFAQQFYDQSVARTKRALGKAFCDWQAEGVVMNNTPEMLAEIFLDLIVSDLHAEAISHGLAMRHSPTRLRVRTEFFLAGANMANR